MSCAVCAAELPRTNPGPSACPSCGSGWRTGTLAETLVASTTSVLAIECLQQSDAGRAPSRIDSQASAVRALPREGSRAGERFHAGEVLAGRFRVVGRIGAGGMGEVWRAEDLNLGENVALKFLPRDLAQDRFWLERFRAEVRAAHLVTHAHVCRVHDMVELEDATFLSMEYVDGEDLASLLRRIGKLSEDKALEIARAICTGLAAAHRQGILHRDLKPANVLVDGRGAVRITDFGLAIDLHERPASGTFAGTPAYMAPEQWRGEPASVQSDLYALGLVLYELFTGVQPFAGASIEGRARARGRSTPEAPSRVDPRIDPSVERAIQACLDPHPLRRPSSALAVAAMLPGTGGLEHLLAAGETPSPAVVAAAGGAGGLRPALSVGLAALVIAGAAGIAWLNRGAGLIHHAGLALSPTVLEHRAREILATVLPERSVRDSASGFEYDWAAIERAGAVDGPRERGSLQERWPRLAADASPCVVFWYRESPSYLRARNDTGRVERDDPAPRLDGMTNVSLSPRGELRAFEHVVSGWSSPSATATDELAAWEPFFTAAGLAGADFESTEPQHAPPVGSDSRAAWRARGSSEALRVEAASLAGRPVAFRVLDGWKAAAEAAPSASADPRSSWPSTLQFAVTCAAIFGGALLARRNLRKGIGDRVGARRIAFAFLALLLAVWFLQANHFPDARLERAQLFEGLGSALLGAAIVWLLYLAFEPYVRRTWPNSMISWTRVISGSITDARVGSDILLGAALSTTAAFVERAQFHVADRWSELPLRPLAFDLDALLGLRMQLAHTLYVLGDAMLGALCVVFLLVILRLSLRHKLAAALAFCALLIAVYPSALQSQGLGANLIGGAVLVALLFPLILRRGLVALVAAFFFYAFLRQFPLSLDFAGWMADASSYCAAVIVLITGFGLWTATRPVATARARIVPLLASAPAVS